MHFSAREEELKLEILKVHKMVGLLRASSRLFAVQGCKDGAPSPFHVQKLTGLAVELYINAGGETASSIPSEATTQIWEPRTGHFPTEVNDMGVQE